MTITNEPTREELLAERDDALKALDRLEAEAAGLRAGIARLEVGVAELGVLLSKPEAAVAARGLSPMGDEARG